MPDGVTSRDRRLGLGLAVRPEVEAEDGGEVVGDVDRKHLVWPDPNRGVGTPGVDDVGQGCTHPGLSPQLTDRQRHLPSRPTRC